MSTSKENYFRYFIWSVAGSVIIGFSAGLGLLAVMYFQVFFGDDSHLKKSTILARINEETTIYYLNEEVRIGSFFNDTHRRYVPIDEVPAHLINAVVASEDKYFYEHSGVNPIAISKAFLEGLQRFFKSGSAHFRGGSTITQQTVKNILDRKEYSLSRKFREAIASLQMERLYDKRQIMEFYLNQFHVAANGNGIGIAARYYFDKDVPELNLVESAFIAGSVKGPSKYNPFIKYTPKSRKRAWTYANQRKNYVLRRMLEQGWIDQDKFKQAWEEPVPFKKGKFTTKEVALVSLVRSQLNKKEILEALGMSHIDELNHAGLKIFTTIDHDLQEAGQLVMRRNLSKLETTLSGFTPENAEKFRKLREIDIEEYYYGKVEKVTQKDGKPVVLVDFGLPKGMIPYDSLVRYAKLLDVAVPIGYEKRLKELLERIKPGQVVYVEAREYDRDTHYGIFELHRRPDINGGLIAIDDGEIRAVVSGFDPQGYNRAIFATKQPGSVFKSVVFYGALQLGWTMLDRLDNERRVFPYQGQFYYPRGDHDSPYREVSMIWSGTKSENLAAVYLTYSLLEKLNLEQFKGLLGIMGLLPEENESKRDYHYRVARKLGVQLENDGIKEFQLQNAIDDVKLDLVFSGKQKLSSLISKMWWGRGYVSELQRLYVIEDEEAGDREKQLRVELVMNNYQRHQTLSSFMENDWNLISLKVSELGAEGLFRDDALKEVLSRFRVISSPSNQPGLGYFRSLEGEDPIDKNALTFDRDSNPGRALNPLDIKAIWGGSSVFTTSAEITLSDVYLDGQLPLNLLRKIQKRLDERYSAVLAIEEDYDLPHYFHHHDFRIALGLNYLKLLCEQMGVFSKIEPVLSFPLGTNVVSVAEVAKIYQTMLHGKIFRYYDEGPPNQLNFIRRIEDRNGNVLHEPKKVEYQLVRPEFSVQIRQILRKVVTHGTGGRARGELYLNIVSDEKGRQKSTPIRVPVFGKTGTTNDYTTASFAGYVPYPVSKRAPLNPANDSYVLSSYVGYDFNRNMVRGGYKVSGAYGALPVWTDFAKAIIKTKKYEDFVDAYDLQILKTQEWPLRKERGTIGVQVDLARGVVLKADDEKEDEKYDLTNFEVTGEEFINEFALSSSVKTTVRIPRDPSSDMLKPLRIVSPLIQYVKNVDGMSPAKEPANFPSQVDPGAISRMPGDEDDLTPNDRDVSLRSGSSRSGQEKADPVKSIIDTFRKVPTENENKNKETSRGVNENDLGRAEPEPDAEQLQKEIRRQQKVQAEFPENQNDSDPGYVEEELW